MNFPINLRGPGGKSSRVQKTPQIASTNIYEQMVTRNVNEPTYTVALYGQSMPLYYMARATGGGDSIQRSETPVFGARHPKGMLLRTNEGPTTVHTVK